MKERTIRPMNIAERVKNLFGISANQQKNGSGTGKLVESVSVPDPVNPLAPLSVDEMLAFLTPTTLPDGRKFEKKKMKGLFLAMDKFLVDSRKYSKQAVDKYSSMPEFVPKEIKVRGIQEQMAAIRFRLDVHDYSGVMEREILKNRLFELYQEAKVIDSDGVQRYERMLDKRIRKAARA